MATPPVVPGYVPLALLVACEAAAALGVVLVHAWRRSSVAEALLLCSRCTRLHKRTEVIGRGADAAAIGALAFLVALPFVAAGYESGFTSQRIALAISAVVAVLAAAAEINFLIRTIAAGIWPRFAWSLEPTRIVGSGARWLGVLFAWFSFHPMPVMVAIFGGIGERLASDLASTATIPTASTILVLSAIAALGSRWLVPLLGNSQPLTFAPNHEPHGVSA